MCERDFETTKAAVVKLITDTGLQLAQYLHPTKEQVFGSADIILIDYKGLSLDDIGLCFRQGLKGQYGDIMRFDTSVICGWLTKYQEEKRQVAMQMPSNQFPSKKEREKTVPMPENMKELKEKLAPGKRVEFKPEIDPEEEKEFLYGKNPKKHLKGNPLTPSELETEAFSVWDKLSKKLNRDSSFLTYGGETYNQDSFVRAYVFEIYPDKERCEKLHEFLSN